MPATAVVDSNVVVAGLLTRRPDAPTARMIDAMMVAELRFAVSIELLAEYHRVLRYPKVSRLHGLEGSEIDDLLTSLAVAAVMIEPADIHVDLADPDDAFLFRLLRAVPDGVLVTGDRLLLESGPEWARVVTPSAFVKASR